MDLPTYTNIWRIEKRLYKLYDFRLPMPLPINWIAVFAGITVPYIVLLVAVGLPFNHTLVWLYVLPPGLLTWLTTRPVIENKRLPELVESQVRYLTEPRVWCRLAPLNEKDQVVVTARVWHSRRAPQRREAAAGAVGAGVAGAGTLELRERGTLARRGASAVAMGDPGEGNAPLAAATALAATQSTAPVRSRSRSRARGTGGPRVPVPGRSGRPGPAGGKTRAPERSWAAQQHQAAQQTEAPPGIWPARPPSPAQDSQTPPAQPPSARQPGEPQKQQASKPGRRTRATGQRSQAAGQEAQAPKPSRFRLAALRSRPAGPAPALPPGVALRPPAEPARSRSGGPALPRRAGSAESRTDGAARSGQPGGVRSWPEAPVRPGAAWPARWTPAGRSAPALGSVPALVPPDLPAHAAPDLSPTSTAPGAPDVAPATPVPAAPAGTFPGTQPPASADARPASSAPLPPAPSGSAGGAPRVEIAHDGPVQRPVPRGLVPPGNFAGSGPVPARPLRPAPQVVAPTAPDPGTQPLATSGGDAPPAPAVPSDVERDQVYSSPAGEKSSVTEETLEAQEILASPPVEAAQPLEVAQAPEAPEAAEAVPAMQELPVAGPFPRLPVISAPTGAEDLAVPSIERALSGPSRDRDMSWHGKVKIVAGGGQGPGKRDQEALDRARARLPLKAPKRVLMLGCTSGAGQTVTTLMTGHILASLREEPVAAVDMHDGALASYSPPAAWLEDVLSGKPPQGGTMARPDGLHPTPKNSAARLDVIASRDPLRDGDELKLAVQLTRHYALAMLDPGAAGLTKLLKVTDQLVIVVPASVEGADALADTRDWLEAHGFTELTAHSVTVINGVSRRSLPDVEHAESVAHGRCRAIVRVPWDEVLPVGITGPSTLRPQTRVAYTALAGVLVAGLAAAPVGTS